MSDDSPHTSIEGNSPRSDWIGQAALAADFGVSLDTLQRWTRQRRGPPHIKVGRRVFYIRQSVLDWLLSREINPKRK